MNANKSSKTIPLDKCEVLYSMMRLGEEFVILNTIEKGTDLNTMISKELVDKGIQLSI
ncbi:MAG: hypothetical protein M0R17_03515 [Candidatus Omnitrophica bacterium]|jgi:hypothetical protein|nr:hypothetical protein [Candidatus Omnitrophota bacterium]